MLPRMGIKITGKLHAIFDTKQVTDRFQKREFVVELADNSRYPQFVMFQLTGDRCDKIQGFAVGDELNIDFSLRGREWTSPQGEVKFFNSLDVWEVERVGDAPPADQDRPPLPDEAPPEADQYEDDVPF